MCSMPSFRVGDVLLSGFAAVVSATYFCAHLVRSSMLAGMSISRLKSRHVEMGCDIMSHSTHVLTDDEKIALAKCPVCGGTGGFTEQVGPSDVEQYRCLACTEHSGFLFGSAVRRACSCLDPLGHWCRECFRDVVLGHRRNYHDKGCLFCHGHELMARITVDSLLKGVPNLTVQSYSLVDGSIMCQAWMEDDVHEPVGEEYRNADPRTAVTVVVLAYVGLVAGGRMSETRGLRDE